MQWSLDILVILNALSLFSGFWTIMDLVLELLN